MRRSASLATTVHHFSSYHLLCARRPVTLPLPILNGCHHHLFHTTTLHKMRVPYAPTTPPSDAPDTTKDIYSRIAARRAPRPLIPLDLALLHNPFIADGWNSLLGAIRSKTSLPSGITELAVCRIAVLNKASYEWKAHAPLARAGGVSQDALKTVLEVPRLDQGKSGKKDGEGGLSEKEWAVLVYTDAMTKDVEVSEETWEGVRKWFGETEMVELTATVAGYNCVSRFLVALNVGENNGKEMVVPE
jgi:alkylhydroperoxidase family enzyme